MVIPKALPFYLYLPSLKIRESNPSNSSKMDKIINVTEWLEENKVALSTPPVCNELMHFGQLIIMFVGGGNIREDFHINEGEELFYQLKGEMLLVIEEAGRDLGYQSVDIPMTMMVVTSLCSGHFLDIGDIFLDRSPRSSYDKI